MAKTIGQQVEDSFLLHALDLELLKINRAVDYRRRFDDLKKNLTAMVVAAELMTGAPNGLQSRLNRLFNESDNVLSEFYDELTDESVGFLSDLSAIETDSPVNSFNNILDTDYFKKTDDSASSDKFVKGLVLMGAALPDWFEAQKISLSNKFQQTITNSARRGFTNDQIVARVRGTQSARQMRISPEISEELGSVQNFTYASPITSRSQSDAVTVMSTAMQALAADVVFDFLETNNEIFRGIQHKSVLDLVTSQMCRMYADKCWDLQFRPILGNILPYPGKTPLHFKCRSQHLPILLPAKSLPADFINSISDSTQSQLAQEQNLISKEKSFNSWFAGIDQKQRIATVGKTFNSAWEKKLLTANDFLSRSGGVSIDLKEYQQRVNSKKG